jgi:hypothetical protein
MTTRQTAIDGKIYILSRMDKPANPIKHTKRIAASLLSTVPSSLSVCMIL